MTLECRSYLSEFVLPLVSFASEDVNDLKCSWLVFGAGFHGEDSCGPIIEVKAGGDRGE